MTGTAERGWLGLALIIAAWDGLCPRGETLTDGARRHRLITVFGVLIIGAHLVEKLPNRIDPLHHAALLARRLARAAREA